jgi:hypothetical protein
MHLKKQKKIFIENAEQFNEFENYMISDFFYITM